MITSNQVPLTKFLSENEIVTSLSEARRLIAQGGVTLNGQKIMDTSHVIEGPEEVLVKAGKRKFVKIEFKRPVQ